jgi:hypothetical protein
MEWNSDGVELKTLAMTRSLMGEAKGEEQMWGSEYTSWRSEHEHTTRDVVDGWIKWVGRRVRCHIRQGGEAYILTLMFRHIGGKRQSQIAQMHSEVRRLYSAMATKFDRNPRSPGATLPTWIIIPDYPVPKHEKQSLRDVTINDGLHMSGVALMPLESRFKTRLDHHFQDHQSKYLKQEYPLARIHAQIILRDPRQVADYSFKTVKRGRVSPDDVLILSARSE